MAMQIVRILSTLSGQVLKSWRCLLKNQYAWSPFGGTTQISNNKVTILAQSKLFWKTDASHQDSQQKANLRRPSNKSAWGLTLEKWLGLNKTLISPNYISTVKATNYSQKLKLLKNKHLQMRSFSKKKRK